MPIAIIYARVSTARQADDGLPVESQIEQCRAKALGLGAEVIRVFRDDGISGRTSKRPGFEAAVDYCDGHDVDYFVCWSTSRFARNRLDAAMYKRLLDKLGTRLVYASQEFGEGDDGWLAEAITEVIDEQYSRQIAKDTRRSMVKNAREGFWNGGRVPFGFRPVLVGKRKRLEANPDEAPTVRLIFRWCIEGAGAKDIASRLNRAGASRRGRRWDKASVSSVLRARSVVGELVYRDRGEAIVAQAHDGIIGMDEFMAAQDAIAHRSPTNHGGRDRSTAIFAGLLRCGYCGDAMTTETATGRGGARYSYYNCRSWLKAGTCRSRRLPVADLDGWLLSGILDQVFTADNLRTLVADLKRGRAEWEDGHLARIGSIQAEQADVDRRLRRLYEAVEAGTGLNLADLAPRMRELRSRQDALATALASVKSETAPELTLLDSDVDAATRLFRGIVEDCDGPRRVRSFLSGVIDRAVVLGGEGTCDLLAGSPCERPFGRFAVRGKMAPRSIHTENRVDCIAAPHGAENRMIAGAQSGARRTFLGCVRANNRQGG
jgi:site-specific DNA recombinase